jgi:hypothetical protein
MVTPKPKKESERPRTAFAEGGKTKMFGKDATHTRTDHPAGEQTPGRTSQKSKNNPKFAEGGHGKVGQQAADPAPAGRTAKPRSAALGGEARPARPGECGT